MRKTTVVIPCYNEANRLDTASFEGFARSSAGIGFLFVNDGSTDSTLELLKQLQQNDPDHFEVYDMPRNSGKAEAVRQGVLEAFRGDSEYVGYFDADLATPLREIRTFRDILIDQPRIQLVMGSRVAMLGRRINRRFTRHLLGRGFATVVSLVLGLPVYDTQCGAKLFRATPETEDLFANTFCSRWIFDVEILARMISTAREEHVRPVDDVIFESPLGDWEDVDGSKLTPWDFVKASRELYMIYRKYELGFGAPSRSAVLPFPAEPVVDASRNDKRPSEAA